MRDSQSPVQAQRPSSFRKQDNFSEHKKFKLSSKPEYNNPEIYGNMIIRNSYMHNNYTPDLDNSNSFKFLKYLNSKSPLEQTRTIPKQLLQKGKTRFKLLKPIESNNVLNKSMDVSTLPRLSLKQLIESYEDNLENKNKNQGSTNKKLASYYKKKQLQFKAYLNQVMDWYQRVKFKGYRQEMRDFEFERFMDSLNKYDLDTKINTLKNLMNELEIKITTNINSPEFELSQILPSLNTKKEPQVPYKIPENTQTTIQTVTIQNQEESDHYQSSLRPSSIIRENPKPQKKQNYRYIENAGVDLRKSHVFKDIEEELDDTMFELNRLSIQIGSQYGFEEYQLKNLNRTSKVAKNSITTDDITHTSFYESLDSLPLIKETQAQQNQRKLDSIIDQCHKGQREMYDRRSSYALSVMDKVTDDQQKITDAVNKFQDAQRVQKNTRYETVDMINEIIMDEEISKKCDYRNFTSKQAVKQLKQTGEKMMKLLGKKTHAKK